MLQLEKVDHNITRLLSEDEMRDIVAVIWQYNPVIVVQGMAQGLGVRAPNDYALN